MHQSTRQIARALQADPLAYALHGGEDFELCFTALPEQIDGIRADFEQRFYCELTQVGRIGEGTRVTLVSADGSEEVLPARGYDHFRPAE